MTRKGRTLALIAAANGVRRCGEDQGMQLRTALEDVIMEQGVSRVLCSMELEIGLAAAEIILELRESYPITLECVIPYEEYTTTWPEPFRDHYFRVLY